MPVRNERKFIGDTLMQLLRQDYPHDRFEILVVDGMSDDETRETVQELMGKYPQVKLLINEKRLSSAGRNVGFREGKGDIFLVVDGHCHIGSDQFLNSVVACFEESGAACLGRPQPLDPPGIAPFQKAVALARASKLGHGGDSMIYSSYEGYASPVSNGAVYKREVFRDVGYVDESFDACEDVEFNFRVEKAGLKAYMSPAITVRYYPRETLGGLFRQMVRYGQGRFRLVRKHSDALTPGMLAPPVFVAGLLLLAAVAAVHTLFAEHWAAVMTGLLAAVYGVYVLLIVAESLRIALKNGFRYLMYLPFILFAIHIGLGWGILKGGYGVIQKQ
ncbi:MAG: glycosyltransferase family 2 protein [Alphaproteobacteria bacterium]|uniref:Glycosyltransferase family 2 protein n=1 Tax=Candidatus Nitrobium versatile TaxID=2884831 RepID=A0A953JDS2_9BACT|nr:glycosyltransferase family 2 protein [Candidatus Nitrobium versatile]